MNIGAIIKDKRLLLQIKQDYLAFKLGISQSNYSRIESNQISVSIEQLEKIAKLLETSTEAILVEARQGDNLGENSEKLGKGGVIC